MPEEERLVAHDRPALPKTPLVDAHVVLRLAVDFVEVVIRVEALVAEVLVGAAGEPVGAGARHEVDGRAAVAPDFGAADRRGHGHRFDRVLARPHRRKEPIGILVEGVVVAHAVERDIQERFRQAVDRRPAHAAGRVDAHHEGDGVQGIAGRGRNHGDLLDVHRCRDRRCQRVDQLGAGAADRDGFLQRADTQRRVDGGRHAHLHPDAVGGGGLEAGQRHGDGVDARRQRRNRIGAAVVGDRFGSRAGVGAGRDDDRAWQHAAAFILDDTGYRRRRAALRERNRAGQQQERGNAGDESHGCQPPRKTNCIRRRHNLRMPTGGVNALYAIEASVVQWQVSKAAVGVMKTSCHASALEQDQGSRHLKSGRQKD